MRPTSILQICILLIFTMGQLIMALKSPDMIHSPMLREIQEKKALYYNQKPLASKKGVLVRKKPVKSTARKRSAPGRSGGPLYYDGGGERPRIRKTTNAGDPNKQTPANDRIFFLPYTNPFWGMPYGVSPGPAPPPPLPPPPAGGGPTAKNSPPMDPATLMAAYNMLYGNKYPKPKPTGKGKYKKPKPPDESEGAGGSGSSGGCSCGGSGSGSMGSKPGGGYKKPKPATTSSPSSCPCSGNKNPKNPKKPTRDEYDVDDSPAPPDKSRSYDDPSPPCPYAHDHTTEATTVTAAPPPTTTTYLPPPPPTTTEAMITTTPVYATTAANVKAPCRLRGKSAGSPSVPPVVYNILSMPPSSNTPSYSTQTPKTKKPCPLKHNHRHRGYPSEAQPPPIIIYSPQPPPPPPPPPPESTTMAYTPAPPPATSTAAPPPPPQEPQVHMYYSPPEIHYSPPPVTSQQQPRTLVYQPTTQKIQVQVPKSPGGKSGTVTIPIQLSMDGTEIMWQQPQQTSSYNSNMDFGSSNWMTKLTDSVVSAQQQQQLLQQQRQQEQWMQAMAATLNRLTLNGASPASPSSSSSSPYSNPDYSPSKYDSSQNSPFYSSSAPPTTTYPPPPPPPPPPPAPQPTVIVLRNESPHEYYQDVPAPSAAGVRRLPSPRIKSPAPPVMVEQVPPGYLYADDYDDYSVPEPPSVSLSRPTPTVQYYGTMMQTSLDEEEEEIPSYQPMFPQSQRNVAQLVKDSKPTVSTPIMDNIQLSGKDLVIINRGELEELKKSMMSISTSTAPSTTYASTTEKSNYMASAPLQPPRSNYAPPPDLIHIEFHSNPKEPDVDPNKPLTFSPPSSPGAETESAQGYSYNNHKYDGTIYDPQKEKKSTTQTQSEGDLVAEGSSKFTAIFDMNNENIRYNSSDSSGGHTRQTLSFDQYLKNIGSIV